jgi:endonuclease YncB( thermonuclease family)
VESRRTGLSLVITGVIMVTLGVVAALHRRRAPAAVAVESGGPEVVPAGSMTALSHVPVDLPDHPLDPAPKAEWEVLPSCRLVRNKTNAAHYFHVVRGGDTFVFQLYGVDAPGPTAASDEEVAEQSRYFGLAQRLDETECAERLGRLGEEAWTAVEELIGGRPFVVFTRWERRPDSHHFYALVYFRDGEGNRRFLQEWLVQEGYAMITRPSLKRLPNGQRAEQFLENLETLQRSAQQRKAGAWGLLSAGN